MLDAIYSPQPGPQFDAIQADWCEELFFGGARGGGKSHFLLGDYLQSVPEYGQAWQGILIRKSMPELDDIISRSHALYTKAGGEWKEQKKTWVFPNGASLKMRMLENVQDAGKYQGHEYVWIGFDELGTWADPAPYRMMKACLRSGHNVPTKRIRATGNPGGAGHQWIKKYFVDPAPLGFSPIVDEETGLIRMFIPSRITDNPKLLQNDPNYVNRLKMVGSKELVRAWLEGDWNVIAGAYFDEFSVDKHVVEPHEIPKHLMRFCAMDWGSYRPFSIGWYFVADGQIKHYPKGAIVKYREWYGAKEPNVGLKLTAEEVAQGYLSRNGKDDIAYFKADPSMWKEDGGICLAEVFARNGVFLTPADNSRIPGWNAIRARLRGEEKPMLYFFATCIDTIRTLPAVQHDINKPEDVDTEGEDHAIDETRYASMSRPWTETKPADPQKARGPITVKELLEMEERNDSRTLRKRI